jgi:hypothetical protein
MNDQTKQPPTPPLVLEALAYMREIENSMEFGVGEAKPTYYRLPACYVHDDLQLIAVGYKQTAAGIKAWASEGFLPVWPVGAKRHAHALLGGGRAVAEIEICEVITRLSAERGRPLRVADVGSNAARFRTALRLAEAGSSIETLHHLVPQLEAGDPGRLLSCRKEFPHCLHRFEECTCLDNFDVFVFQHSLYHFTPETLCERIPVGVVALASVHHVWQGCGSLLGEGAYMMRDDGMMVFTASGNDHSYVHRHNAWLRGFQLTVGEKTLCWSKLSSVLGTHLYRLEVKLNVTPILSPPPSLGDAMSYGDVSRDYLNHLNGELKSIAVDRSLGPAHSDAGDAFAIKVSRIEVCWGMAVVHDVGRRVVVLPLELVGFLRTKAAGQVRDGPLRKALYLMGQKHLVAGGYPADAIPRILTIAVCAAFTLDIESETAAIGAANRVFGGLIKTHAAVLSGAPLKPKRWWDFLDLFRCCGAEEEYHTDEGASITRLRNGGIGSAPMHPMSVPPSELLAMHEKKTRVVALDSTALIKRLPDLDKAPLEATTRLVLIGVGHNVPTTYTNDADTFVHGLSVRVLRAVPPETPGVWEFITGAIERQVYPFSLFHVGEIEVTEELFQSWLQRFPRGQLNALVVARKDLMTRDLRPSDCIASGFTKVEKAGFVTPNGIPDLDARVVSAFKPSLVVTMGPVDWTIGKRLREALPVVPGSPAAWINGREADAESFGALFDAAIASTGGKYRVLWGDQSRFESAVGKGSGDACDKIAQLTNPSSGYLYCQKQLRTFRGRGQRHPVTWTAKDKLGSGLSKTSYHSLSRNALGCIYTFGTPEWGVRMYMWNGDDWLLIMFWDSDDEPDLEMYARRMSSLGFTTSMECGTDLTKVEFCQLIPYPTEEGTVWGPKIGRVLSRLPYATSASRDDPAGVATGMLVSCGHIPFLREYLQHVQCLAPTVKAVDYEYHVAASRTHTASDATWAFINERYGLDRDDLAEFRSRLRAVESMPGAFDWPFMDELLVIDA